VLRVPSCLSDRQSDYSSPNSSSAHEAQKNARSAEGVGLAAAAALGSELIDLPERIIGSRSLGRRLGSAGKQQLNRPNAPAPRLRLKEFDELGLTQRPRRSSGRPIGLKCKMGER
jgi:hypothetical protein